MRRQSGSDRLARLNQGCCPVHGGFMAQVDGWYYPSNRRPYTLVGCSRRDCSIQALAESYDGPWKLPPEFTALLDDSIPDPLYEITGLPPRRRRGRPRISREKVAAMTDGRCYYCGSYAPETITRDHIVPISVEVNHNVSNLAPACKSCNSAKGSKDLEDFRFYRSMQKFQESTGVAFTSDQVKYLRKIGVQLDIPRHTFWFELEGVKS